VGGKGKGAATGILREGRHVAKYGHCGGVSPKLGLLLYCSHRFTTHSPTKAVYSSHNNRLFIIISSLSLQRYINDTLSSLKIEHNNINTLHMNNTKYENLYNDWCHSCTGQLHKSHWTPSRRQSFTREVVASHLVSPSRLQVARQSYILEVSHIHLCD